MESRCQTCMGSAISAISAHSVLLPLLCCRLPLYDELMKRLLTFAQKCFICDNKLVNFMVRYAVWHGRMKSPLGCSIFRCCSRYDFEYERSMLLSHQYIQRYCWTVVSPEDAARAQMLLELLFIRSGAFYLLVVNCFSFLFVHFFFFVCVL